LLPAALSAVEPALVRSTGIERDPRRCYSARRTFSARVEYAEGNSEFVPIGRFTLEDEKGNPAYTRSGDNHTLLDIADNGAAVGIDFDGPVSGRAELHFYDPQGIERGAAEVEFLNERAFSANSTVYCVNDGRLGLRVFDLQGKELYNPGTGNRFAVAPDGRTIALAGDEAIALYTEGTKTGRIPLASPFIRQMKFSPDGSLLGYVDRKNVRLYSIAESRLRFQYRAPNPDLNFVSLDVAPDNGLILAGSDEDQGRGAPNRHSRGFIYLLDAQGNSLWQQELRYSGWSIFVPQVEFGPDRRFQVRTAETVYEYRY
jgi:hypothetical protein